MVNSNDTAIKANAFASTFFFLTHNATTEKNKMSLQVNAQGHRRHLCKLDTTAHGTDRRATDNTGLAKVAVQCFADTFVVKVATFAKPETVMSKYFDSLMVWGPISGRMFYSGLRFSIK